MIINQRLLITLGVFVFILIGTYAAVKWAQGYRFNMTQKVIEGTGLLVANSQPQGASVYIDGVLKTATDDTLHLQPGSYSIKLERDGYATWEKQLRIDKELVTQTNARLFPAVPDLMALTVNGASDPTPSPDGHKIAYKVASNSAETKRGIWVLQLSDNPLRFGSNSVLIAKDTPTIKFSQAQLFWSPNSNEILAYFNENQMYLLNAGSENNTANLLNATFQVSSLLTDWQQQLALERMKRLEKLPIPMQKIATESATLLYFSPNEEKILYTATASATLPDQMKPPLPAINSQPQQRDIKPGNIYVYDNKEDTNFLVRENAFTDKDLKDVIETFSLPTPQLNPVSPTPLLTPSARVEKKVAEKTIISQLTTLQMHYSPIYSYKTIQWFPNSQHLIVTETNGMKIMEYDGTNSIPVFSGPFVGSFAYPWPNGQKLIMLTSLTTNPEVTVNLYALDLQ